MASAAQLAGPVGRNIRVEPGDVTPAERAALLGQQPVTVWLTGLPGSGKSTLATTLERRLHGLGKATFVLDGDNLRHGLNSDLDFSPAARRENIRRVAEVARLMNDAGVTVITAFISPYREDREAARRVIGPGRFIEVYLGADLATCEARDPKGLYKRARAGALPDFTGVSAPYEIPTAADLVLDTGGQSVDACIAALLERITGARMKQRLLFDHIPKTAGTAIVSALSGLLGEEVSLQSYLSSHHDAVAGHNRRFAAGHLWFAAGESLRSDWYYATILRDPVDRFLSQYYFNKVVVAVDGNIEQLRDPHVQAASCCTLEEYLALTHPVVVGSYTNTQAIHFAQRICEHPEELSEPLLLEAAITSLREYDIVGIFEETQAFLHAICDDLGLPRPSLERANVTPGRRTVAEAGEAVIARLRAANAVDLELMAWARREWAERQSGVRRAPVRAFGDGAIASRMEFGSRSIRIESVRCAGSGPEGRLQPGEPIVIECDCAADVAEDDLTLGVAIRNEHGHLSCGTNSRLLGVPLRIGAPQRFRARFSMPGSLPGGSYSATIALHVGLSHAQGCYHWLSDAVRFTVAQSDGAVPETAPGDARIEFAVLPEGAPAPDGSAGSGPGP